MAWESLDPLLQKGYPVIAVDGGANPLMAKGIVPDLVIGDLDSVSTTISFPEKTKIIEISEQQTTDFEKALYSINASLFICFGFWGSRLDHSLAALHMLTKYRSQKRVLLIDECDLLFIPQGPFSLALQVQTRISIIPLEAVTFENSQGLKYPLDGLTLETGISIGVSNQTTDDPVLITPTPADADNYAVILPNQLLPALLQQLNN